MSGLLSLLTGGNSILLALGAALLLAIGSWIHGRVSGAKAQQNADKAKEAEARDKNIEAIKRAAAAQPTGSVSDDPFNLDK